MKKILSVLLLSIVMIGVSSCSSDDGNSNVTYSKEQLVGSWEHVSSKVFDPKGKVLGEVDAESPDNCGVLLMSFTEEMMEYRKYEGKDGSGKCIELRDRSKYVVKGNRIYELDEDGDLDEDEMVEINGLSGNSLLIYQRLNEPIVINGVVFKAIEMKFKRK